MNNSLLAIYLVSDPEAPHDVGEACLRHTLLLGAGDHAAWQRGEAGGGQVELGRRHLHLDQGDNGSLQIGGSPVSPTSYQLSSHRWNKRKGKKQWEWK